MAKPVNELIIEGWQAGEARHPLLGFGHMRNVDIKTNPGSVRINNLTQKRSSTTVTGLPIGFRINPNNTSEIYSLDVNGVVYKSVDSGVTWSVLGGNTGVNGSGIAIWKDYLLVANQRKIDAYGPLSSTAPTWTTRIATLEADAPQMASDVNTLALWHMDGTPGSTLKLTDSSGNSHTLTEDSAPLADSGAVVPIAGGGYVFNGTNQDLTAATPASFNPGTNNMTIEGWFKTTSTAAGYIISKRATGAIGWWVSVNETTVGKADFSINNGGAGRLMTSTTTVNDGVWHYFAAVIDYTNNAYHFYIDGVEEKGVAARDNTTNAAALAIGSQNSGAVWFAGSVDEIRISSIARTAAEISNYYNNVGATVAVEFHTMLESIDDKLYACSKNYILKLQEVTTFVPSVATSFTNTAHAITLSSQLRSKTLADFGQFLMIGTWRGVNVYDFKTADLYPYSRQDLTLGIPVKMHENGVNALLSLNNRLYIQAGIEGKIFVSDSTSFSEISEIPNYVVNLDGGKYCYTYPGAIVNHKGKIYFGLSSPSSVGNMGVWSIYPTTGKNILQFENSISTGNDGSGGNLFIGALLSTGKDSYLIGWQDETPAYGIDQLISTLRYTGYAAYIDSPLYQVGEALGNRTFAQVEVYLDKPLISGQGVRIQYRKNLTDSFTTLGTYDFTSEGSVLSFNHSASVITQVVFLQIRILLTTGASNLSPEVKRIMFKMSS